jgi:hypothetical protein
MQDMSGKGGTMAHGLFGRFAEVIGVVMRSENLDELPEAPLVPRLTSFFSRLLTSESLPFDDEAPGERAQPRASGLFAFEALPRDDRPEPHSRRSSFIATLFSRESLPVDPVRGSGPAGRATGH